MPENFTDDARLDAVKCPEVAHDDLDGEERSSPDWRDAWVGLVLGIGQVPVERSAAASKCRVFALHRANVIFAHRGFQACGVDARALRQFGQRVPLDQVAIAQELADGHRRGLDEADAVLGEGRLVAHEPHRRFLLTGAGANQRGPHIVI